MSEHPHIALFRSAHEAYERGDTEAMRSWFSDDFVWHEPGDNPLSGDYVGADEVFGLFDRIAQKTDGHFDTHLEDVLANGEHVVALLHLQARSGAKEIDMARVNVYRANPDGRVSERWGYVGDQAAFDDLFA
ncbi:MAG TPA: nuclear transport factor 2 family protein [Candidatus Limnocylindrales bacterium]|jgi:ketosteroid isomerase-like protein